MEKSAAEGSLADVLRASTTSEVQPCFCYPLWWVVVKGDRSGKLSIRECTVSVWDVTWY